MAGNTGIVRVSELIRGVNRLFIDVFLLMTMFHSICRITGDTCTVSTGCFTKVVSAMVEVEGATGDIPPRSAQTTVDNIVKL